jgi:alpha-mannosidase
MTETWQRFIWHQFHDDLTGTSIPRAYEFSWNDELLAVKKFSDVLTHSVSAVADKMDTRVAGQPVVVYNNETTPVRAIAQVVLSDNRNYSVADADGHKVVSQIVERNGQRMLLFDADVPATGMAVYGVNASGKSKTTTSTSGSTIESSRYKLTVDDYGDVVSLIDKNCSRELVASGKSLRFVVFDDCRSEAWPAWEIQKATLDKAPLPVHDGVEISIDP